MKLSSPVRKITSGGQTGVDRAALDWAMANGLAHGRWCPKGRCAEDGAIDHRYQLTEVPQGSYRQRTRRNTLDSDGTLIFYMAPMASQTAQEGKLIISISATSCRPFCLLSLLIFGQLPPFRRE